MRREATVTSTTLERPTLDPTGAYIARLRAVSLRGLARMYLPNERLFCWCLRRRPDGSVVAEGTSLRYTAIAAIGLARERPESVRQVLGGPLDLPVGRLLDDVRMVDNLGDAALILWAARALRMDDLRAPYARLSKLLSQNEPAYTVELAWALAALSLMDCGEGIERLRRFSVDRLLAAWNPRSRMFRHKVGGTRGLRAHVCCFADLVYPTQALSLYALATGDERARDIAALCAGTWARLQGSAGQWWWHYDARNGRVIERYPVYSVHQDAMGPMALFAAEKACGLDFSVEVRRSLDWLARAPELSGGTLLDEGADVIWRKVSRREPHKLARRLQAFAAGLHPALRVPGLDGLLPPGAVDFECRPYHLGWLLHAFPERRLTRWRTAHAPNGAHA